MAWPTERLFTKVVRVHRGPHNDDVKHARSYYCACSLKEKTVSSTPCCRMERGFMPCGGGRGWEVLGKPQWGCSRFASCPQSEDTRPGQAAARLHTAPKQPREGCTRHRPWQRGWKNPPLSSPSLPLRPQVLGASSNIASH